MFTSYKRTIALAMFLIGCFNAAIFGQTTPVTYNGFGNTIYGAISDSFGIGGSPFGDSVKDGINIAVGHNGAGVFTGIVNGTYTGDGLTGQFTLSSNFTLTSPVLETSVTSNTSVSWTTYANPDGSAHVKITVNWGNSSQNYSRDIDARTVMPNEYWEANGDNSNPPSGGSTGGTPSGTPGSGIGGNGGSSGSWVQISGSYETWDGTTLTIHNFNYWVWQASPPPIEEQMER